MIHSPSRRIYHNYHYTQFREENPFDSINNLENRSQRSPQVNSPHLNAQSDTNPHDLKDKLDTILKHNSQLLNQNALLSQMVNTLRLQLSTKTSRDQIIAQANKREISEVLQTVKTNQILHQKEIQRLLQQITVLHDQCYHIQLTKNAEIKTIKEKIQRQLAAQTILIKRANDDGKQIMELQIKKLKQALQLRQYQIQTFKVKNKSDLEQLASENNSLKNQIKHIQQINSIQIHQLNSRNKQNIQNALKQIQRQKDMQMAHVQNSLKKLKNQVMSKNIIIQQKNKILSQANQQSQIQIHAAKLQKQQLLVQIKQLQDYYQTTLFKQKQRVNELAEMEKQNLTNINQTEKQCFKAQINKLNNICLAKSHQIKKLYQTIKQQKDTFNKQIERLQNLVIQLRSKIKEREGDYIEELQLLKIKMGQLHRSDIQSIQSYYQNEIASLLITNNDLKTSINQNRQKIYQLLRKNDQIRKNFQVELSKQKAKVQDFKLKLAAIQVEHKQQIASIGTKMQLTSQTLIRQTEQKHKTQAFFQNQKRKLYTIIENKDKQVRSVNQLIQRIRQLQKEQKQLTKKQIDDLRIAISEKDSEIKNMKKKMQQQYQKLKTKMIQESKKQPDEQIYQQNKQLRKKITELQAQSLNKQKNIQFLKKQLKSLQQQLGLRVGFIETMQLQSQAAIQDQKSKLKIIMNQNQVSLRTYFQDKIMSKDKDINHLKAQLEEKEKFIRDLIIKYNGLELRLEKLMEAQDKLRQFQQKVVNMGLDHNLVKNVAELFARYRKSSSH